MRPQITEAVKCTLSPGHVQGLPGGSSAALQMSGMDVSIHHDAIKLVTAESVEPNTWAAKPKFQNHSTLYLSFSWAMVSTSLSATSLRSFVRIDICMLSFHKEGVTSEILFSKNVGAMYAKLRRNLRCGGLHLPSNNQARYDRECGTEDLSSQSWNFKYSKSLLMVSTHCWTTSFKKLCSLQDLHPILRNNSHERYWIERKLKMWRFTFTMKQSRSLQHRVYIQRSDQGIMGTKHGKSLCLSQTLHGDHIIFNN